MNEPSRWIPLIFDYLELRLRMPARRANNRVKRDSGIRRPISRVL